MHYPVTLFGIIFVNSDKDPHDIGNSTFRIHASSDAEKVLLNSFNELKFNLAHDAVNDGENFFHLSKEALVDVIYQLEIYVYKKGEFLQISQQSRYMECVADTQCIINLIKFVKCWYT